MHYYHRATASLKPALGISSCLIGENVRYDGENKDNLLVRQYFRQRVMLVPFCPEVAAGMGIPREPIRLETDPKGTRARQVSDPSKDFTQRLTNVTAEQCRTLARMNLSGYLFKARSPSCGVGNSPLHNKEGQIQGLADGIAAATLQENFPELPVISEAALLDENACEQFLTLCKLYHEFHIAGVPGLYVWHNHYHAQGLEAFGHDKLIHAARKNDRLRYWRDLQTLWQI